MSPCTCGSPFGPAVAHKPSCAVQQPEPRTYCIGLPVIITVHPDGRVTHEVDMGEATDIDEGVPEDEKGQPLYSAAQVAQDVERVSAWLERGEQPPERLPG